MELYHVLNRGVDKRQIFLNDRDRLRFVHDLYEFNDTSPAGNAYKTFQNMDVGRPYFGREERDKLVDIHGWVLMGNHYHLLLSERKEGGISLFLKKLNGGYAKYFNENHERSGTLFQGRTKRILIHTDAHFLHILHYIHLNPLDFLKGAEEWRNMKIANRERASAYLTEYRWSSFLDYCGEKNFPSLITTELFADVFRDYKKHIASYLKDIDLSEIESLTLE